MSHARFRQRCFSACLGNRKNNDFEILRLRDENSDAPLASTMSKRVKEERIPQKTFVHFQSIPWCAAYLEDSSFKPFYQSRFVTPGDGHTLTGRTWNTDDTIVDLLSTYRAPTTDPNGEVRRGEVRRFYSFGKGLNAHPGLLHGGVIATLLDSTLGSAVTMANPGETLFTAQLNVTYKHPVSTPATVLVKSWVERKEGRKTWVKGRIESGTGVLHAEAEGMWLQVKPKM
jgi:acyl-coenzyme A thioesterase PaaI-like protein